MEQLPWPMGPYRRCAISPRSDKFYRRFIDSVISFFTIGLVLYILARIYGAVTKDSIIKNSYKCKYCRKEISETVRLDLNRLVERVIQFISGCKMPVLLYLDGWQGG
jgi:hypothetical protein